MFQPEDVGQGRQEIYDTWVSGWSGNKVVDESALQDSANGAVQLGFNSEKSSICDACV